ncbi:hypothetical protein [Streptomyces sp. BA2]|uniref:hypothetical protein n=1 Tax=Streptomyces sp. BA2 TaxID=436595 RepID=UPI0013227256|nr:hypothetical protein [Streptomyces sp. BA2]MWA07946.1 hypothetical protein [Streptomyces sp. BA2]
MDAVIDYRLSQLPLVGGGVSADEDVEVQSVGVLWANGALSGEQVSQINAAIDAFNQISDGALPHLPVQQFPGEQMSVTATVDRKGESFVLVSDPL